MAWYLSAKKFPRNIPYYSWLVTVIVQICGCFLCTHADQGTILLLLRKL